MSFVKRENQISADRPILFNQSKSHTPFAATLTGDFVRANAEGNKPVPAGMFVCRYDNITRYLPRAEVVESFAVGATSIKLGPTHPVIVPNDRLFTVEPYGRISLSGTFNATDYLRLTLDGYVFDFQVGQVSNTVIAKNFAHAISQNPALSKRVYTQSSGSSVTLYSKTGIAYTYEVDALDQTKTNPSATGVSSPSTSTTFYNTDTFVGEVSHILENGTCYLKNPTTIALDAGAKIGAPITELIGVDIHSRDFRYHPVQQVAPYYKAIGVYETNLPYVDWHIKRELSDLNIRKRF